MHTKYRLYLANMNSMGAQMSHYKTSLLTQDFWFWHHELSSKSKQNAIMS